MDIVYATTRKSIKVSLDVNDPGSRYRVSQLEISVSGKSKMIRTIFRNIEDVAKDMQVRPDYIVKYIGYILNARASGNSIAGQYSVSAISEAVKKFIINVVCCAQCGRPEIKLVGRIKDCQSCGLRASLPKNITKFYNYVKRQSKISSPEQVDEPFETSKEEDVVWYSDLSDEAVARRRECLTGQSIFS